VLIVAALGGNALLRRGEPLTHPRQQTNIDAACGALAPLARDHRLVLTHGNGPQVGLLALEDEKHGGFPLDVLDAETEGMIGYLLERELRSRLPGRAIATLLTQVRVAAGDPAFAAPSKPVGPVYTAAQATRARQEHGWTLAPDGKGFRRVVPSPQPLEILGLDGMQQLLEGDSVVICGGGGGIPVAEERDGTLRGVEAVIDKDLLAALLAERLEADLLLILTDVEAVVRDWGTPNARAIRTTTPARLRRLDFAAGSMGPKVEAACRFVERTGGEAVIGALEDAATLPEGGGTRVVPASRVSRRRAGAPAPTRPRSRR
jgi:carbamate kinase